MGPGTGICIVELALKSTKKDSVPLGLLLSGPGAMFM